MSRSLVRCLMVVVAATIGVTTPRTVAADDYVLYSDWVPGDVCEHFGTSGVVFGYWENYYCVPGGGQEGNSAIYVHYAH
jgi:hypothetical protein